MAASCIATADKKEGGLRREGCLGRGLTGYVSTERCIKVHAFPARTRASSCIISATGATAAKDAAQESISLLAAPAFPDVPLAYSAGTISAAV